MRLLLAVPIFAAMMFAQQDMGVITGVVSDVTAGAVPGASIVVTNRETNEVRAGETGPTGAFTIGPLRVGTYSVAVEKTGFKKAVWESIELHAQDRVRADFQLQLGQINESVSVTSEAPLLQSESSTVAHVVQQREIRELPLNGRNFQQLAWLTAGVTPAVAGRDRDSGFNSHGQWMTQNNFIIDGVDNNNNVMGMQDRKAQVMVPSLDAVAEFKVETSNYSAEFGRNSGAVMIVSIKSGANQVHGTLFDYLRNDIFDARDVFNYVDRTGDGKADPEKLRQNQYGGTVGGPIRRDKTFFFFSLEDMKRRLGQSDLVTVPNADEKNGIFSPSLIKVKDPLTGQPFPDNVIPRSRFDASALKLLDLWPQANFADPSSRQNYARNPPYNLDRNQYDTRIDHNVSDKDKIFGRFSYNKSLTYREGVFQGIARGGQGNDRGIDDNGARSLAFSYTRIISPTWVNEFRYGFIRQKVDKRELETENLFDTAEKYGIHGLSQNGRLFGLPQITLSGAIGYQNLGETGSMPNFKIHQVHQYLDNLSWNHGNHNVKIGTDLRWNRSDIFGGGNSHGNLTFDGSFTGVSLGDFLLGLSSQAALGTQLIGQMRFRNYMWYAQDDWKVTPRLTLNVGLRYELTSPWLEKHNNMNKLNLEPGPDFGKIIVAGACGDSWSCRGNTRTDINNFAPRVGIAYQITPKTIFRSGAGVFYGGQGALGASERGVNNFPYNISATLQSSGAKPAIQLSSGFPAGMLAPGPIPPDNANFNTWDGNIPEPMIYQWNVSIQRELARNLSLTTAYVGSSSNHLMDSYNWNGSPIGPVATEKQRRKLPAYNTITFDTAYAHATYQGLDVQLDKRLAAGFSLTAAYTWSHAIDNIAEQFGAGGGGLQDFTNFDGSRGNSNFDTRHRFVTSAVYELPFFRKNRFLGGWQLSGMTSAQTGHYFGITVPNSRTRLGATAVGDWRADRTADGKLETRTADRWFDTSAFLTPRNPDGSYRFGNSGRDILSSDGPFNVDAGLMKIFRITERVKLQFRGEFFNVTNTPTLGDPNRTLESPDLGKVRSTTSTPRQMQFALRLSF